ncbi:MAG: PIG-L family deacetylase [Methanobacterium sp.]|nr:PIG-L family deacetylase [Methanobacterium sp.]
MLKKKYYLSIILLIVCVLFISISVIEYPVNSVKTNNSSFIESQDKVLVVAPHPDDEAIACAGVIRYCTERNISVKIVVLTDGYLSASPMIRHDETVSAMELLGVKKDDIIFLGYRDGTLPSLLNKNWESGNPYNLSGNIKSEYNFSYKQNSTYSGDNLYSNLEEIISKFQPTIIFYPDSEDEQIDHWAGNAFTEYVMAKTNYQGAGYTYIVHNPPDWPSPRTYNPEMGLTAPEELTDLGYNWVYFPLNQYQQRLKESAFNLYSSQIKNTSFVRSFIRKNEIFATDQMVQINSTPSSQRDMIRVIQEPTKKEHGKSSIRTREIKSADFSLDNESAWLSINTRNNISMNTIYEVHILYLDNHNWGRIDVKIYDGILYYQKFQDEGYDNQSEKVEIEGNQIKLKIPSEAFKDINSFLISADIISGNTLIDWTGWRRVEIVGK